MPYTDTTVKNLVVNVMTSEQYAGITPDDNQLYLITDDNGPAGVSDAQVNGTSVVSNGVANIVTNTAYNASSNKIATMSDIPSTSNFALKSQLSQEDSVTGDRSLVEVTGAEFVGMNQDWNDPRSGNSYEGEISLDSGSAMIKSNKSIYLIGDDVRVDNDGSGIKLLNSTSGSSGYTSIIPSASPDVTITLPSSTGTLALSSQIPTIPSNVSSFTNDAGYLTLATLPIYNGEVSNG